MNPAKQTFTYELEFSVRDYECDLQGIVNNSVYLNYLEHTRHQYLLSRNLDYAGLHKLGIDLLVYRIEIDYKSSLRSGDRFLVRLRAYPEGPLRIIFEQQLLLFPENRLVVQARVTGVGTRNGRPLKIDAIPGCRDLF